MSPTALFEMIVNGRVRAQLSIGQSHYLGQYSRMILSTQRRAMSRPFSHVLSLAKREWKIIPTCDLSKWFRKINNKESFSLIRNG